MDVLICEDVFGRKYEVPAKEVIPRTSVYGILIKDDTVLLIKDDKALQWEFPGGGLEEGEEEFHGLKREIEEESGIVIGEKIEFITKVEEFFYQADLGKAYHSHRMFYKVFGVEGGELLVDGGEDTLTARWVPLSEVRLFGEDEMKEKYRKLLFDSLKLKTKS